MNNLQNLYNYDLMPKKHKEYLKSIQNINPAVIYDIGSCVLHWARPAKNVWPNARILCFDAIEEVAYLHKEFEYFCYVLSDKDGEEKYFYKNLQHPGGQSLYKENELLNPEASKLYNDSTKIKVTTHKLDTIVEKHNLPLPNLIKIDVQGAELDILKGATKTISQCNDIIVELQKIDWNIGAPKKDEAIEYMKSIGYECVAPEFSKNRADADYHFKRL